MMATEYVYKSHDNKADVSVSIEGSTTPLQGVTRITCELHPSGVVVDSDITPAAISWTDAGVVTFDFGDQSPSGLQRAVLLAFDPAHPDGQVLSHPLNGEEAQLNFKFVD